MAAAEPLLLTPGGVRRPPPQSSCPEPLPVGETEKDDRGDHERKREGVLCRESAGTQGAHHRRFQRKGNQDRREEISEEFQKALLHGHSPKPKRATNSSSVRIGMPSSRARTFLEEVEAASLFTRKAVFFETLPATLPPFAST